MSKQVAVYDKKHHVLNGEFLPYKDLRGYQRDAIIEIKKRINQGQKHIGLMLPTGSGKTKTAVDIILGARHKGKRVLFIVDTIDLVEQTSAVLDEHDIDHGVYQADHWRFRPWEHVQVATIQTLMRRKYPDSDLVIIDEFHCFYKEYIKMMDMWNSLVMIGLSATPWTRGLGKFWDSLVVGNTVGHMMEQGYLCGYEAYGAPPLDLKGIKQLAGDYNQGELAERVNTVKIIGPVVQTWIKRGKGRPTICFSVNVAHAINIAEQFRLAGVNAISMSGKTKDRKEEIERFKRGEIEVLVVCQLLTKGFDHPATSCVILARPTKSLMLYVQQVGRGLRPHDESGKDHCLILDHGENIQRHGFPDDEFPTELDDGTMTEKQKQDKKEKEEPLPKVCPQCFFLKPPKSALCPMCGFLSQPRTDVKDDEVELVKLSKTTPELKRNREWPNERKQAFYGSVLGHAAKKGYKQTYANAVYREWFGVWPNARDEISCEPTDDFKNYLKHKAIKWRNRRDQ